MSRNPLHGVLNQTHYPGSVPPGDWDNRDSDECWLIATYLAEVMAGWRTVDELPTIRAFRAAAGVPDHPNQADGGTNAQIAKAIAALQPDIKILRLEKPWEDVLDLLHAGWIASLAVWSGLLPSAYRYGFFKGHQVTISWDGHNLRLANPLAPQGSEPQVIPAGALIPAAEAFGNGNVHAVMIAPHGTWYRYGGRRLVNSTPFVAIGTARVFDRPTLLGHVLTRLHKGDQLIPHQVTERGQRVGTGPQASWWIGNANGDRWVRRSRLRRAS